MQTRAMRARFLLGLIVTPAPLGVAQANRFPHILAFRQPLSEDRASRFVQSVSTSSTYWSVCSHQRLDLEYPGRHPGRSTAAMTWNRLPKNWTRPRRGTRNKASPVILAGEISNRIAANSTGPSTDIAGGDGGGRRWQNAVRFLVSDSLELALHRGSITDWAVDGRTDAIVNAANSRMLGGGGVDGAIHRAAGPRLKEACKACPEVSRGVRCPVGEARVTPGFDLPVSRVIHTVGPRYFEDHNPAELLRNAFRNSLTAAAEHGIKFIAFPAISCGMYSYPVDEAATIALSAIREAPDELSEIHFVLFEQNTYSSWLQEAQRQFQQAR